MPSGSRVRKRVVVIAGVAVLATVAIVGYVTTIGASVDIDAAKLATVERGTMVRSVVATGKVEPITKVEIKSKANGIIKALRVDVDSVVREGDVLAELDKDQLLAQVRGSEANLLAARAALEGAEAQLKKNHVEAEGPDVEFARRAFRRAQSLFEQHLIAQSALDDANSAVDMAENRKRAAESQLVVSEAKVAEARAQVAQAKAAADRAAEDLANATIRAPIKATVLTRDVELGSPVSSILNLGANASLVMTLGDIDQVFVRGRVDEADIGHVRLGQSARIRVETFKDKIFNGKVTQISPMGVEKDNVTNFEVRVSIDNPGQELKANMTANAEIVLEEHPNSLILPEAAIVYDSQKHPFADVAVPGVKNGRPTEGDQARCRKRHEDSNPRRAAGRRQGRSSFLTAMWEVIRQTFDNLRANKLRSFLTMFGILWGMISIVILSATGEGFRRGNTKVLLELGKNIGIVWGGRTSLQAGGERAGRRISLTVDDARALAAEASLVEVVSPELERAPVRVKSAYNSASARVTGMEPPYEAIRTIEVEYGRLLSWTDEEHASRVALVGYDMADQLFGKRHIVGETVTLNGLSFTVVGKIRKKDQDSNYNGPDNNKIFVPFATMMRDLPRPGATPDEISDIVVAPKPFVVDGLPGVLDRHTGRIEDIQWPLEQNVRSVLARRHGFDPDDREAISMWDTSLETLMFGRMIDRMKDFFSIVGLVTLGLGGIGVMNIMLVAVKETHERDRCS